jgi:four helix bundle protein
MPKEETTMATPTDRNDTALELAKRAFTATVQAVAGSQRGWSHLVDQAVRAASSVPLNLAESDGRDGNDRRQHRRIAYGSAKEARVALELLVGIGAVEHSAAQPALRMHDRVCAMIWRLMESRR